MIPQAQLRHRTDATRSGGIAPDRAVPGHFSRAFKHPRFMHYYRLIALVMLVDGALLARHLARGDWHVAGGSALSGLADLIVVNFAIAVLIRQQHVLNAIFAVAGRGSSRWPLRLRWMVSKINHIGGLHVGAAMAGTAWLCAFTVVAAIPRASPQPLISRPSRPRADRPEAVIGMKDRADDGKASRGKKGPADPLNEPGGNKQLNRRGRRAQRGGGHEDRRPRVNTRRRP